MREKIRQALLTWCGERGDDDPILNISMSRLGIWSVQVVSPTFDHRCLEDTIGEIMDLLRDATGKSVLVFCFTPDEWEDVPDGEDIEFALARFSRTLLKVQTRMHRYAEGNLATRSTLDRLCEIAEELVADMEALLGEDSDE